MMSPTPADPSIPKELPVPVTVTVPSAAVPNLDQGVVGRRTAG